MKPVAIIIESVQALRANLLRSSLTVVGIVVGIFAVTAMLALGAGLSNNILDRFNSFSAGDIIVQGSLYESDIVWIQNQKYVAEVLATQSVSNANVVADGETLNPTIRTYVGDFAAVEGSELVSGTLFDFNDITLTDAVAIVDEGFITASVEGIDQVIINGKRFSIIGVIEGGGGRFGRQDDGNIIVPYKAALGVVANTKQFSSVGINLLETEYYEIAGQHILESLNSARFAPKDSEDYFSVISAQSAIESAQETTQMLSIFLAFIGSVTLFVGGIGTMNMMLTTVTERTKEIGLRKAIGARNKDILLQILAESVALTLMGGLIGIIIAAAGSAVANRALEGNRFISVDMSWGVVLLAISVSCVVGIIFGYYPAKSASKLQPVDALRAD